MKTGTPMKNKKEYPLKWPQHFIQANVTLICVCVYIYY